MLTMGWALKVSEDPELTKKFEWSLLKEWLTSSRSVKGEDAQVIPALHRLIAFLDARGDPLEPEIAYLLALMVKPILDDPERSNALKVSALTLKAKLMAGHPQASFAVEPTSQSWAKRVIVGTYTTGETNHRVDRAHRDLPVWMDCGLH